MLRSFTLKNFRCFQNLTIEPLERVNLIAGKNNVGKTSLLEAIFIFINPTNPESPLQVNSLRGIGRVRFEDIEEMRGFFFDQDVDKVIELSSIEENQLQRSLKIYFPQLEESQMIQTSLFDETRSLKPKLEESPMIHSSLFDETRSLKPNESLTTEDRSFDRLVLDYQDPTSQTGGSRTTVRADGRLLRSSRRQKFPLGIYLTTSTRSPREDAERFSNLERIGRQDEVLDTLRVLEPRLQRLTLLVVDREPIIHGDIGMSELVPLPLMGEGIGRLLSIILAIANAKGGTILIDEIENGLHYSVLTDVWKAIADAARRAKTQIFATTHSLECIKSAHEAFEASENYDFRYHRLERVKEEIRAVSYDQENLAISDEMNLEMR